MVDTVLLQRKVTVRSDITPCTRHRTLAQVLRKGEGMHTLCCGCPVRPTGGQRAGRLTLALRHASISSWGRRGSFKVGVLFTMML